MVSVGKAVKQTRVGVFASATFAEDQDRKIGASDFGGHGIESLNGGCRTVDDIYVGVCRSIARISRWRMHFKLELRGRSGDIVHVAGVKRGASIAPVCEASEVDRVLR